MVWSEVVFCWVVVWGGVSPWASVSGIWVGDVSVGIDGGAVSGAVMSVSVGWFAGSFGVGVAGSCVVVVVVVCVVSWVVGCVSCPHAVGVVMVVRDVVMTVQRARCFMCFVFMV